MVKAEIVAEIDARIKACRDDMKFLSASGDYQGAANQKVKVDTLNSLKFAITEES